MTAPHRKTVRFARIALIALPLVALTATLGSSVLEAGVSALRPVTGTNKSETLRGSSRADKIQGYAGNDRIYGIDSLAEKINGGIGTDTAEADEEDELDGIETVLNPVN